jgi:hypothetical protein
MNAKSVATLTAERWRKMKSIFHAAIELEEFSRLDFILRECDGNRELAAEIEQLLLAFQQAPQFHVAASPPALPQRSIFGEYSIERVIGQGGMGTVYLAHRADGQGKPETKGSRRH